MRTAMGSTWRVALALVLACLLLAATYYVLDRSAPASSGPPTTSTSTTPVYSYEVVGTYPHDTGAFTEGLVYYNGTLYESTGLNGDSSLRRENITTGQVIQIHNLPSQYFGEGIAIFGDEIVQLTYTTHIGFVYSLETFQPLGNFTFPDQGWGLTYNGTQLIMSDGSDTLYFLNPQTFQRTGEVTVHDGSTQIDNLNSLDYINGSIFANVWLTNRIAVINASTGEVTAWLDLAGLQSLSGCHCDSNDVLNGIAYDASNHRLYVTGKDWPDVFQIRIDPPLPP